MTRTKTTILIVALIASILVAAFATMAAVSKGNELRSGALDGFSLNGQYSVDDRTKGEHLYISAAFLEKEGSGYDGEWQLSSGAVVGGRYRKTFDPNVFDLYDEGGKLGGRAHLAYTTTGTEGLIYIEWEGDGMVFPKRENQPGFVVR